MAVSRDNSQYYRLQPGGSVTIHFNQLVVANVISITKTGFLTLCEVDVLGTKVVLDPEGRFSVRFDFVVLNYDISLVALVTFTYKVTQCHINYRHIALFPSIYLLYNILIKITEILVLGTCTCTSSRPTCTTVLELYWSTILNFEVSK